jgi:hypothetical protein
MANSPTLLAELAFAAKALWRGSALLFCGESRRAELDALASREQLPARSLVGRAKKGREREGGRERETPG